MLNPLNYFRKKIFILVNVKIRFGAASGEEMTHCSYKDLVRDHLPKEQANLSFPLKHKHASGGQTQAVFISVTCLEDEVTKNR